MIYKLIIKRSAEHDLRRLPRALFLRINKRILALQEDPRPAGVRKLKGHIEGWRMRVGDYWIVYLIDDQQHMVTIIRVRHRRDVYH